MRRVGIEPTTFGLEDQCSIRLSYRPKTYFSIFVIPAVVKSKSLFWERRVISLTGKRIDPRVVKTRANLRRALVGLMQHESLDTISVQKITTAAHITRGTFYLHYKDKQDFIQAALSDFVDDFFANVIVKNPETATRECSLSRLFSYVERNVDTYAVLFGPALDARYLELLFSRLRAELIEYGELVAAPADTLPVDLQADFVASALIGVLDRWLAAGMPYSPRAMARSVSQMLTGDTPADLPVATFFASPQPSEPPLLAR